MQLPSSPPPPPGPIGHPSSSTQKPPNSTARQRQLHPPTACSSSHRRRRRFCLRMGLLRRPARALAHPLAVASRLRVCPLPRYTPQAPMPRSLQRWLFQPRQRARCWRSSRLVQVVSTTDRSHARSCHINSTSIVCSRLRMQAQSSQNLQGC